MAEPFLVKDIYPGSYNSYPRSLTAVGDTLYFRADDGVNGTELWRSDGTEACTVLVKDINPGSGGSGASPLTAVGDTLYFGADDGVNGDELWAYPSSPFDAADLSVGIYNTQTDQLVTPLADGDVFLTDELTGLLTLAVTIPDDSAAAGKVVSMQISFTDAEGGQIHRIENVEPYAVFGDREGDFFRGVPFRPAGDYSLDVEIFSEAGGRGESLDAFSYDFSVIQEDFPEPNDTIALAIESGLSSANAGMFVADSLIGNNPSVAAESDVDLISFQLDAGDQVEIDIDAQIIGSSLDSILRLSGSAGSEMAVNDDSDGLDSFIRYTASQSDTYYAGVSSFGNFDYDPFTEGIGFGGSTGSYAISIEIPVIQPDDLTVGIYNTQTDRLVTPLEDGDLFSTDELTGLLTLAVTVPDGSPAEGEIGSVKLTFTDPNGDKVSRMENVEPYALFGDRNGDFFRGIEFVPGDYCLRVTAYSRRSGNGVAFGSFSYAFTVEEDPACSIVDLSTVAFTSGDDVIPEDLVLASAEIANAGIADTLGGDDQFTGVSCSSDGIGFANSGTLLTSGGNDVISGEGYPTAGFWNRGSINTGIGNDTITALGYDGIINNGSINFGQGRDVMRGESTDDGSGYGIRNESDGVIKMGSGNDIVSGSGAVAGILNLGKIYTGAGADLLTTTIGGGGTPIENLGVLDLGAGNDEVSALSFNPSAAAISVSGSIITSSGEDSVTGTGHVPNGIGILVSSGGSIHTGSGNDNVTGQGGGGIKIEEGGILSTGSGDDLIEGIGGLGINMQGENAVINAGAGNDLIRAASPPPGRFDGFQGIGKIYAGSGNDTIDALMGDFDMTGRVDMGRGKDKVLGFYSGTDERLFTVDGGPGQDTILGQEGVYQIEQTDFGFVIIADLFESRLGLLSFELIGSALSGNTVPLTEGILTVGSDGGVTLV